MKTLTTLSLILVMIVGNNLEAQDLILLHTGDEISAKVTEVQSQEVIYKRFDNINGPQYRINKNEIFMIKYESGTKDVFKSENSIGSSGSTATIYFYRPRKFASSKPKIIVGTVEPDEVILKLKNGSWYKADYANLGERQFATGVYVINPEYFTLDVAPGSTYYIRCTVLPRGVKIMAQMELVDQSTAQQEMAELKEQNSNYVN